MSDRMRRAVTSVAAAVLLLLTSTGWADEECDDPVAALPAALRARYVAAERMLLDDDAESAADYADLMLAEAPRSVAVVELAARVYQAMGEQELADALADRLRELCPGRSFDLRGSAPAGPLDQARARYRDLLAATTSRERQRLLPPAIAAYEQFLDADGASCVEARHALAVLYLFDGRLESSRGAYRWLDRQDELEAREVPEYLRVLRSLAHASPRSHYFEEGRGLLASWRDDLDDGSRALAERHFGFTALHLQQFDAAREALKAAIELAPDDAESHYGLAMALEHRGRGLQAAGKSSEASRLFQRALDHARRAVEHPRYGEAARSLIATLQFRG